MPIVGANGRLMEPRTRRMDTSRISRGTGNRFSASIGYRAERTRATLHNVSTQSTRWIDDQSEGSICLASGDGAGRLVS
jgi:diacylglycerol kinase family enzyme